MPWIKGVTPQQLNDMTGIYQGQWMPEMDRCWFRTEDHTCVCSRLIRTQWGKVEHVTITRRSPEEDPFDIRLGDTDFTWADKQKIKDELFGKNRTAIEVYPKEKRLVDESNIYHLWVFDKNFDLPFGIHPKEYTPAIKRGSSPLTHEELMKLREFYSKRNTDDTESKGYIIEGIGEDARILL